MFFRDDVHASDEDLQMIEQIVTEQIEIREEIAENSIIANIFTVEDGRWNLRQVEIRNVTQFFTEFCEIVDSNRIIRVVFSRNGEEAECAKVCLNGGKRIQASPELVQALSELAFTPKEFTDSNLFGLYSASLSKAKASIHRGRLLSWLYIHSSIDEARVSLLRQPIPNFVGLLFLIEENPILGTLKILGWPICSRIVPKSIKCSIRGCNVADGWFSQSVFQCDLCKQSFCKNHAKTTNQRDEFDEIKSSFQNRNPIPRYCDSCWPLVCKFGNEKKVLYKGSIHLGLNWQIESIERLVFLIESIAYPNRIEIEPASPFHREWQIKGNCCYEVTITDQRRIEENIESRSINLPEIEKQEIRIVFPQFCLISLPTSRSLILTNAPRLDRLNSIEWFLEIDGKRIEQSQLGKQSWINFQFKSFEVCVCALFCATTSPNARGLDDR